MNVTPQFLGELINLGASCAFFGMPFLPSRVRAPWANHILFVIAGIFLIIGVHRLVFDLDYWTPSNQVRWRLNYWIQGLRGVFIGCILALLVSGELPGRKVVHDPDDA